MSDTIPQQQDLPLPLPELATDLPLLPVRMLNEYQYCPRLAYLEWVQGEWTESADTVEGRRVHRRVDRAGGHFPPPDEIEEDSRIHARSVTLSSNKLGLIAKVDLLEADGGFIVPVDYKRGRRPHVNRGAYDPERVQLCAQGLLLEENGYRCMEGVLYFASSKERVGVSFDEELRALTRSAIEGLRLVASGGTIPPPLVDSPKCPRCSLVAICLPDEVNFLVRETSPPRPLAVARDDALPVYIQARSAKVAKQGETLEVFVDDTKVSTVRLAEVSQLVLMGNVCITTPCLHELMTRDIPITWQTFGGWFVGHSIGTGHRNVELRAAQYRASFDKSACLRLSKRLVIAKIQNCRTQLRRNWKDGEAPEAVIGVFKQDVDRARRARSLDELLGAEGNAAARYFGNFSRILHVPGCDEQLTFDFTTRNRRPPSDPVNALLSFAYALLVRTWTMTLSAVGFDPYRGFYHQPRYGRPALALDMMEPFRPLIADSSVIQAINNGEVKPTDFISVAGSVALTADGRRQLIAAFERRLDHEVTHPLFGYRVSYRRLLELQARLLGRHLLGELSEFPSFITR